jgi:hypothetical protein
MVAEPRQPAEAQPHSLGDRNEELLLKLLSSEASGPLTVATLIERGVRAPAQTVYALQVAGYQIDRIHHRAPDGSRAIGYLLRPRSAPH